MNYSTWFSVRGLGVSLVVALLGVSLVGSTVTASWKGRDGDIYVVKSDGVSASVERRLPDGTLAEVVVDCVVPDSRINTSPDGKMMTYACAEDGDAEIFVKHLGQADAIQLTDNAFADLEPTFSPNGDAVVFSSNRDGNSEIYTVDIATKTETRITNDPSTDRTPEWSISNCAPNVIFFVSDRDGDNEIWSWSVEGSVLRQWTNNSVDNDAPDTGGTGCGLLYSEMIDGVSQIVMRSMTSPDNAPEVRQITTGPDHSFDPTWNPERIYILFSRQAVAPGSPVRVHKIRYSEEQATLLPGQNDATIDYGQPEWAVEIEDGATIARTVSLNLKKHLKASGKVTMGSGNNSCAADVSVELQKKKGTSWVTIKTAKTGAAVSPGIAKYTVGLPDKTGAYRVLLEKFQILGGDTCGKAVSPKGKHVH